MLQIGEQVDRYVVEGVLGEGGMATVYRARHGRLRSIHAIKLLTVDTPSIRLRLLKEGRVQAGIRHPNIVAVTDVIEFNGRIALVMEFVEGASLHDRMATHIDMVEALHLFRGILAGLAAAHDAGLVHRDLKPANILLAYNNLGVVPKITDFGLVKVAEEGSTITGTLMGTPRYMSPEQVRDASTVDHRSDLWSVGVMLYEVLAGVPPFQEEGHLELFNEIVKGEYVPLSSVFPGVPRRVELTVDACLQLSPDQRLQSAEELLALLFDDAPALLPDLTNRAALRRAVTTPTGESRRIETMDLPPNLGTSAPLHPTRAPPADRRSGSASIWWTILIALGLFVLSVGLFAGLVVWSSQSVDSGSPAADNAAMQPPRPSEPEVALADEEPVRSVSADDDTEASTQVSTPRSATSQSATSQSAPVPAPMPAPVVRTASLVSASAFRGWLSDHPEWSRETALRSGRASDGYLRGWTDSGPGGPATRVTWQAATEFCAGRGGLLGLEAAPMRWPESAGVAQEWRDGAGRPAWRRFDGETSTVVGPTDAFSFMGFRCRR